MGHDSPAKLPVPMYAHCRDSGTSPGDCRGTGPALGKGLQENKGPWLSEQYGFRVSAMTVVCLGNCGCCFSWGWSNISFQIECPTASHFFVAQMYWGPHCWKLPSFMFTCMMQAFCHFYFGIFVVLSNSSKGPLCFLFLSDTFFCRMVFE